MRSKPTISHRFYLIRVTLNRHGKNFLKGLVLSSAHILALFLLAVPCAFVPHSLVVKVVTSELTAEIFAVSDGMAN